MKASRGFGCEVRTIWGHPQLFESIGICVMSLAQKSEVRVLFGVWSWLQKVIALILFTFSFILRDVITFIGTIQCLGAQSFSVVWPLGSNYSIY